MSLPQYAEISYLLSNLLRCSLPVCSHVRRLSGAAATCRIIPVMVFDGADLPSKGGTEASRKSSRNEYRAKGMQALRMQNRAAAVEFFQRAVEVTPQILSLDRGRQTDPACWKDCDRK